MILKSEISIKQEVRITPLLVNGLHMLTLPAYALYDYVVSLAMSNPFISIPEPPQSQTFHNISSPGDPDLRFRRIEGLQGPRENRPAAAWDPDGEKDTDPFHYIGADAYGASLRDQLQLQLSTCRLNPVERAIGSNIIDNLDSRGFFVGNLTTVCRLYDQPEETGRRILALVQGFSPRGIAARDIYECLCLQVDDGFRWAEEARQIIREDLDALCSPNGVGLCMRKYGLKRDAVERIFSEIRSFNPRPGNCDEERFEVSYTAPEIIIRRRGGGLDVYLSGTEDSAIQIDDDYLRMMDRDALSPEDYSYMRSCLNGARSLIRCMETRKQLLNSFALELIRAQNAFFLYGPEHLSPLSMQQMADRLEVNVSTVSRIVQNKLVSTPWGIYPIKYFFARSLTGESGEAMTTASAKKLICRIIEEEDAGAPLTDAQISEILRDRGYGISRRTVTKYRESENIPPQRRRIRKGVS